MAQLVIDEPLASHIRQEAEKSNFMTYRHEHLDTILSELRETLQSLYGGRLAKLVLYGSQARGDATPESDIDVMAVLYGDVNVCEEIDYTNDAVADLSLKYNTVVACIFMSASRYEREESRLLQNMRTEGLLV